METTYLNGWYLRTDGRIGPWTILPNQQPTSYQIWNAYKVKTYLENQGWSLSAICGTIGNMVHESTLSPAFIEETNRWRLPNSAANLTDVPNSVMQNFYRQYYGDPERGYGIGLVQWDGLGITRQKLVGYCENNGLIWYEGDSQMSRIQYEQDNDLQWTPRTYYGTLWTWDNYVINTRSPENSANIWLQCYEISSGQTEREGNARWFYDYFTEHPDPPPVPPDPPVPPVPTRRNIIYWISKKKRRVSNNVRIKI